jgi:hypothetical protein
MLEIVIQNNSATFLDLCEIICVHKLLKRYGFPSVVPDAFTRALWKFHGEHINSLALFSGVQKGELLVTKFGSECCSMLDQLPPYLSAMAKDIINEPTKWFDVTETVLVTGKAIRITVVQRFCS